ncbi:coiled-coil domain-containing protein [Spongiactinospora sp. 9N601]|uniref:coiled-coil domain-containing protein n=1 Tax=Spongiactinospora sp. 9N601 TaxID=3375149 RepID=UPI0037BC4A25
MRSGRRPFAFATVLTALILTTTFPGAGAAVAPKPKPQAELKKLTQQAASLNKRYRGQIQDLEEIRVQAKKANDRAGGLKRELARAEREVTEIAQTTYMGGSLDAVQLIGAGDVSSVLGPAAMVSHLSSERARKLGRVQELIADSKKARQQADQKIDDLKKEIELLKRKRRSIERLLAKYGFQTPSGGDGLTARMVSIRNAILAEFPMPYGYGCLRPGDPGEHGSGRACDFMMSRGTMPGQIDSERGDALAQWCIKNGPRLGIMYIIWKQRYYDVRTGAGWRPMSDRGGITANHWDHVHVSVF